MRWVRSAVTVFCIAATSAQAIEKPPVDPQHTLPAIVHIFNATGAPLLCGALLAHWFKIEFGVAGADGTLAAPFEIDPADQTVFVRNERQRAMVVEDLYCQGTQASWETAVHLDFRGLALRASQKPVRIVCARDASQSVRCRSQDDI